MKIVNVISLAMVAFFGLTSLSLGQAETSNHQALVMRTGHILYGEVVKTTDDSVTMKTADATVTYHAMDLDPNSFYMIRSHTMGDDAAAHLKLGNFAKDHGLFAMAKLEFQRAKMLDPSVAAGTADQQSVENGIAAHILDAAKKSFAHGAPDRALRYATDVATKHQGTPAAKEAATLIAKYRAGLNQQRTDQAAKRKQNKQKTQERISDSKQKLKAEENAAIVAPFQKMVDRAQKHSSAALSSQGSEDAPYRQAIGLYKEAIGRLSEAVKTNKDNAEVVESLQTLHSHAVSDCIQDYITLGGIYLQRTAKNEAIQVANEALKLDPTSEAAKAFLNEARTTDTQGGWVRGGLYRPRVGRAVRGGGRR